MDVSAMCNTLTFREEGEVVVVDVHGKLIGADSEALRATLQELVEAGYRKVFLDMAGVTLIDTAGIGELVVGYATLARVNGRLKLLNLQKPVEFVLRATRLESVLETYEREREAILSF
jgi:anti-sigma B factor antagonist